MNTRNPKRLAGAAVLLGLFAGAVYAESPMVTDDAGTLDAKGAKLEAGFSRSGPSRSAILSVGYAPIENLEIGLAHEQMRDHSSDPSLRGHTNGLAVKWVPVHQGPLSAGLKLELARAADSSSAASTRSTSVTGLVSYMWESGYALHANLGRGWDRSADIGSAASTFWSIGAEMPIATKVKLTGDWFGASGESPGALIGLRWTVAEGVKLSAGIGRANSETIANAGVAWEF